MSLWISHPFFRIILAFSFGIIAARFGFEITQNTDIYVILGILLITTVGKVFFKKVPHAIWGNLLLTSIFLLGALRFQSSTPSKRQTLLQTEWEKCQAYIGTITSFPTDKGKFIIHHLDLNAGIQDSIRLTSPAKLLLYEKKIQGHNSTLRYGDKIRVEGHPFKIAAAKNPDEFDFSQYMADQHIFLQQFVSPDQIELIERNRANGLMSAVYRVRSYFENNIKSQVKGDSEEAIVLALLLGIKGQLDPEIKSAYAAAGAMHVLAVSGLHVSIIYFILNWLFRGLPEGDLKRFVKPTVSIIALWLYALLTGFSPSILRAVSMFSIIIFAQILNRKGQIFNSLAFAAFILLLFDPNFLFNIGFQLSFLAVAGIVYIYPKIYAVWNINSWLGDYFWKLTCVSIAAQVATFPLSLYYFHQFPSYFLIANLIVIPGAFAIMLLGIGALIFGSFTPWLGWSLEKLVFAMNWFVEQIQQLDGSVIDWIYISGIQACFIYVIIWAFFALLKFKKSSYALVILLATIGFSLDRSWDIVNQSQKEELIFYSIGKDRVIDLATKFDAKLYTQDTIDDFSKQSRRIEPYRIRHLLPAPEKPEFISKGLIDFAQMQVFKERRVLFLTKPFDPGRIRFRLQADVVVISNQSVDSLSNLDQMVDFKEVIIDNTNGFAYTNQLKKEALNLGIKLFSLREQAHLISLSRDKKFLDMLF